MTSRTWGSGEWRGKHRVDAVQLYEEHGRLEPHIKSNTVYTAQMTLENCRVVHHNAALETRTHRGDLNQVSIITEPRVHREPERENQLQLVPRLALPVEQHRCDPQPPRGLLGNNSTTITRSGL